MGEPQLALDVEAAAEMGRRGSHSITEAVGLKGERCSVAKCVLLRLLSSRCARPPEILPSHGKVS